MTNRDSAALTLDAVHPDPITGPAFQLLAAAPLFPTASGLFLCTFTLQYDLAAGDPQPQASLTLETGPAGVIVGGGSQDDTQGGLVYAKGAAVTLTGQTAGVVVANCSQGELAPGRYGLTGSGIAKAPLRQTSAIALLFVDDVANLSGLILTMAVTELPDF